MNQKVARMLVTVAVVAGAAGRAGAMGLFEAKPEPRALITMFGVMVEARNILTGVPMEYKPNQTSAAQLFPDALTVPAKTPALAAVGVAVKRYGGFIPGSGGEPVSVYFLRLGKDGAAKAVAADLIESNWVTKDRCYLLGAAPGTYAVAAVVVHEIREFSGRGLYFHRAFFLDDKALKASTVTVAAGEMGVAGEVTFKTQKSTDVEWTKDKAWQETWKAKGHVRNLKSLTGKWLIYRARVPEEVGVDSAKMIANFEAGADDVQKANRALLATDSGFPLCGLPDDLEVEASKKQKEDFLDDAAFDLKNSPWGEPDKKK